MRKSFMPLLLSASLVSTASLLGSVSILTAPAMAQATDTPAATTAAAAGEGAATGGGADATEVTPPVEKPEAPRTGEALKAYNAGIVALNNEKWADAAVQLQRAVELSPNDAGFHMFLGYVQLQQENYDAALASLEAAKRLGTGTGAARLDNKSQTSLYNNLGIVYWKKEQFREALAAYRKALELNKDDVDARYNLAFGLLSQKQYAEAIPHLLPLRSVNPTDDNFQASVYDGLAEAYENTARLPDALGALKRVVELKKNDPAARYNFALMLSRTGRPNEAIKELIASNKMFPQHAPTLLLLGDLYTQRSKWEQAQKTLQRYVQLQPEHFSGWFSLGVSYDYGAKFDEALVAYARAEALQPQDTAVKNNIGRIYFKRKNQEQATAKLREALAIDSNFDDARINLALSLAAQEKFDEANGEWKIHIQKIKAELVKKDLVPKRREIFQMRLATAHGAMAENYLKSKAFADAVKEYRFVLTISPKNIDAMSNLGLALYHSRQLADAAKTYRQIIQLDPANAVAHNNLGVVLEALNRPADALKSYKKAVELNPNYAEAIANEKRLGATTTKGTTS